MNNAIRQLTSAAIHDGVFELEWSDNGHDRFHSIWLRDNCRCTECGDPAIGYRSLYLTSLDLNPVPRSLTSAPDQLSITWEDGHESCYAASWLSEYSYDEVARAARAFKPEVWNDALRASPPHFAYSEIVDDDAKLLQSLQQVRDHGICFLHGAPPESGVVEA